MPDKPTGDYRIWYFEAGNPHSEAEVMKAVEKFNELTGIPSIVIPTNRDVLKSIPPGPHREQVLPPLMVDVEEVATECGCCGYSPCACEDLETQYREGHKYGRKEGVDAAPTYAEIAGVQADHWKAAYEAVMKPVNFCFTQENGEAKKATAAEERAWKCGLKAGREEAATRQPTGPLKVWRYENGKTPHYEYVDHGGERFLPECVVSRLGDESWKSGYESGQRRAKEDAGKQTGPATTKPFVIGQPVRWDKDGFGGPATLMARDGAIMTLRAPAGNDFVIHERFVSE